MLGLSLTDHSDNLVEPKDYLSMAETRPEIECIHSLAANCIDPYFYHPRLVDGPYEHLVTGLLPHFTTLACQRTLVKCCGFSRDDSAISRRRRTRLNSNNVADIEEIDRDLLQFKAPRG